MDLGAVMALLLVIFITIVARTAPMIFGAAPQDASARASSRSAGSAVSPLVTGLVALAVIGVLAWPLERLLSAAAMIAGTS